jgi:hypothetical protein
MDTNVSHVMLPAEEPHLLAQARPFPDPPSSQGSCSRCGYRGTVYPGRYGGFRCPVCFGLQYGWMPRERDITTVHK